MTKIIKVKPNILLIILAIMIFAGTLLVSCRQVPPVTMASESPETELEGPYSVTRIVDGDTIVVNMDGKDTKIRLIGIDTPGSVHPDNEKNRYFEILYFEDIRLKEGADKVAGLFDKDQPIRMTADCKKQLANLQVMDLLAAAKGQYEKFGTGYKYAASAASARVRADCRARTSRRPCRRSPDAPATPCVRESGASAPSRCDIRRERVEGVGRFAESSSS